PFKEYTFDISDSVNLGNGKVATAVRHNYLPNGDDYAVTESFEYKDTAGRPTDKTTQITLPGGGGSRTVTQGQSYDDLGAPAEVSYPSCGASCGSANKDKVINSYANGFLQKVQAAMSDGSAVEDLLASEMTYWPSGMVHTIP